MLHLGTVCEWFYPHPFIHHYHFSISPYGSYLMSVEVTSLDDSKQENGVKKDDILSARALRSLTLSLPSFQFGVHFLFRSRLCKSKNLPILLWTSVTAFNCPFLQTSGKARRRTNPRGKKPVEWMQKESKIYKAFWFETNSRIPCCSSVFFLSRAASWRRQSVVDHPCRLSLSSLAHSGSLPPSLSLAFSPVCTHSLSAPFLTCVLPCTCNMLARLIYSLLCVFSLWCVIIRILIISAGCVENHSWNEHCKSRPIESAALSLGMRACIAALPCCGIHLHAHLCGDSF